MKKERWIFDLLEDTQELAILIDDPNGLEYWHQYGGIGCSHIKLVGHLAIGSFVVDAGLRWDIHSIETVCGPINDVLDWLTVRDDLAAALPDGWLIDDSRDHYEALVALTNPDGRTGWLVWENSD